VAEIGGGNTDALKEEFKQLTNIRRRKKMWGGMQGRRERTFSFLSEVLK
jgi:hypothetical protein